MNHLDLQLINKLQHGFPICEYPYAAVAAEFGCDESTVIERLGVLLENKTLTRFGPMYHAEHLGGALTLAALAVPEKQFNRIAKIVNAMPEVAHNYKRTHELNMWFVIATEKPEQLDDTIKRIEKETGFPVFNMPKLEEFYVGFYLDL